MRDTDRMIDLRELPLRGGERVEHHLELEIEPLMLGGLRYDVLVHDDGVRLRVDRVSGGFLVTVSLSVTIYGPCYRCLGDVMLPLEVEEQEFVPLDTTGWPPEDVSPFIDHFVVDVGGLAREAVVLALPPKVLCRDDCAGICSACGRPAASCGCPPPDDAGDPRWQALRSLRSPDDPD